MQRTVQGICLFILFLFFAEFCFAQGMGDNQFHFVKSFSELPEGDTGGMTNIKYVGDTDQDNFGEFVFLTTNGDSCHFVMYEATGDESYEVVFTFPFKPVWNNLFRDWTAITVGDLNANGVVEILVGLPVEMRDGGPDVNPPRLAVFEWNGTVGENMYGTNNGTEPSAYWNFGVGDNYNIVPFQFTIDDIDNDGDIELIADIRDQKAVYVVAQRFPWDFAIWEIEWYITSDLDDAKYVDHFDGGGFYGSAIGDLDNDGEKEIYVPVWNFLTLNVYECHGDRNYTREANIQTARSDADYGAVRGIHIGDVNSDGVKELYIAGTNKDPNDNGHVFVISNITDVSQITAGSIVDLFTYPTHPNNSTSRAARTAYLTDADNDGNDDLMIWGSGNGQLYDLEYQGSGDPLDPNSWTFTVAFDVWEHWSTYLTTEIVNSLSPRFWDGDVCEDMDGDGRKEFLIINYSVDRDIVADDPFIYIIEEGSVTSVEEQKLTSPDNFALYPNYPNPFNSSTTIRFDINQDSQAALRIYDVMGREIKTLFEGALVRGAYRMIWNGRDNHGNSASSGIYLLRIQAGSFSQVKEMTLLR
jgi:hypothetical protein